MVTVTDAGWISWGYNFDSQCARGVYTTLGDDVLLPPALSSCPTDLAIFHSGEFQGCGYRPNGDIYVWGQAAAGQFGNQITGSELANGVLNATKLNYADAIATSAQADVNSVWWLKPDGTLWAIGNDAHGTWGIGNTAPNTHYGTPVQVASGAIAFAMDDDLTHYYIDVTGNLWYAGSRSSGLQGTGSTSSTYVTTWTQVPGIANVVKVWSSGFHTLALDSLGQLWGWGSSFGGVSFGITTATPFVPNLITTLPIGAVVKDCLLGTYWSYCLLMDGRLFVTGRGVFGSLGLGNYSDVSTWTQTTVGGLLVDALAQGSQDLASGYVIAGGMFWACGANEFDTVDAGTNSPYNTFQNLVAFSSGPVTAIAVLGDEAVFVKVPLVLARSFVYCVGV